MPLLFIGAFIGQLSKQDPAYNTEGFTQLVHNSALVELNEQILQFYAHGSQLLVVILEKYPLGQ
jgi:hypothetical protein